MEGRVIPAFSIFRAWHFKADAACQHGNTAPVSSVLYGCGNFAESLKL